MASFGLYRLVHFNTNTFRLVTKFIFQLQINIKFRKLKPTIDIAFVRLYNERKVRSPSMTGHHGSGIYHNIIIPVPRVYLKYIPVVSFDVRCQSGIYIIKYGSTS